MKINYLLTALFVLSGATAINAQRSPYQQMMDFNKIINNRIMNDMMNKNMCEDWRRKGQKVPASCSKYTSSGSSVRGTPASASNSSGAVNAPAKTGSVKFTPVAGDRSFQKFADDNGSNAEEKQLMLQIATSTKALFEERYGPKGWKNNLAGALAFFIVTNMTVYNGAEPNEVAQKSLFEMLNTTFSQSADFVNASNKDKQEFYNTMVAYSGLPLTFYADAAQKGDRQGIEKARQLSAGYIEMFLGSDPESLNKLLTLDPAGIRTNN